MKIDILCTDGSPLGVTSKTIWGDDHQVGVGGAELALITMCEAWTNAGYEVVLYNDPREQGVSPFEQRERSAFQPSDDRDVLITFRTPNPKAIVSKGLKVWWSTDQYTSSPFKPFAPHMNKIVCISPFHSQYFLQTYGIDNTIVIDLPIRIGDFVDDITKVSKRVIFTSVPDRGLPNLLRMWNQILLKEPDASLVITSDYRLWGISANNEKHRAKWMLQKNVKFIGALSRALYLEELGQAEIHLYPCHYDELFCISVAEAQVAGAYTISSGQGSLLTTNMGKVIQVNAVDPRNDWTFIDATISAFDERDDLSEKAKKRFSPNRIVKEWDEKVFS